jgi:hypothetical protein
MMNSKNTISCPACEYERNSLGQPIERDGQMECLDCGSTWRVFGTAPESTSNPSKPVKKTTRVRELAEQVTFAETSAKAASEPEPSIFTQEPKSYKFGLGVLMASFAAFLLFAGVYVGMIFLEKDMPNSRLDVLNIAEIEIEEQVRRNGEKVFTVKGLVSNPTGTAKTIPPIAIILRKQNGGEITRWYYNSSLASLRPGGKSRFASSIQYDTPIVAYAEAVFK